MRKTIASLAALALMAAPSVGFADTGLVDSLQSLLTEISKLKAAMGATAASALPDDYGTDDSSGYCPNLRTTIQRGATDARTGGQVTELQRFLADRYDLDENVAVSGFFGKTTQKYTIQFQAEQGLPALGIVGSLTRAAIARVCSDGVPSVTPAVSKTPGASIDATSLSYVTDKDAAFITITGYASNVSFVDVSLDGATTGAGNPRVSVSNGRWTAAFWSVSHGNHSVLVSAADPGPYFNRALASGTLKVSGNPVPAPSASIDPSSLTVITEKDLTRVIVSGSATGVDGVDVGLKGYIGGYSSVTNGRWSVILQDPLPLGVYLLQITSHNGSVLTTGQLIVSNPTASYKPFISSTNAKAANNFEADAGGELVIFGQHLATPDTTHVSFAGIPATVTWSSDTKLIVKVPANLQPGQPYDMYVTNTYGTSNTVRINILSSLSAASCIITSTTPYASAYPYPQIPVTLSWSSVNATTGVLTPYRPGPQMYDASIPVPPNSSLVVNPNDTTDYTLTVTGPGTQATCKTQVGLKG